MKARFAAAAMLAVLGLAVTVPGRATPIVSPNPEAMALQADPHDFVTRTDTRLNALGDQLRFGAVNISTLALRGAAGNAVVPTEYETNDLLTTAQAMGAGQARVLSLGVTAGCADCLVPALGKINPEAFRRMDHLLKLAHDAGIRLFIPLSGGGDACAPAAMLNPVRDTACVFAHWRNQNPAAFYTDAGLRADFANAVTAILSHINGETGVAYRNDTTIAAWENCDGCGRGADPAMLADWTEWLGQRIKSVDTHHLYENGAFAGRLADQPTARLALPSVDILGDRVAGEPDAEPTRFTPALDAVIKANRAYVIDSYDWSAATWHTPVDLQMFMDALRHDRRSSGAFVSDLYGHADQGGYVKPPAIGLPPFYFPGFALAGMDADSVQHRARAVRRLSYRMMDLEPIAFAKTAAPQIISVVHGNVHWRGSASALVYSIERSGDLTLTGSWQTLCDKCASDTNPFWQDPAVPNAPVWYRMTPFNVNLHSGIPSAPVANR